MFTGEAPGKMEDRSGLGFQGPAGKKFDMMLSSLGMARNDIWLNNAVRCRPLAGRKNRAPTLDEMAACRIWLDRDIRMISPQLIVPLGRVAYLATTGAADFTQARGKLLRPQGLPMIFPLFHPAYLIYRQEAVALMCQDLRNLRNLLDLHAIAHTPWEAALCGPAL
jgi:DNA polymerase